MSRFEDSFITFAAPQLDLEHGVTVTLQRDGKQVSFTARRETREHEVTGVQSMTPTKVKRRSYVFLKSKVDFGQGVVDPKRGDRFTEGSEVYEIMPPGNDLDAVEELNDYEWMVHCKRVT